MPQPAPDGPRSATPNPRYSLFHPADHSVHSSAVQAARRDILKIIVFIAAVMLSGALLAPWLFNAGKALAEMTQGRDLSPVVCYVADATRRSEFPRYFDRALLLSALVLLIPAIHWLRIGQPRGRFRDTPWSLRIPDQQVTTGGQPLRPNPYGILHMLIGLLFAAGTLLISGRVLVAAGWFNWREGYDPAAAAASAVLPAIAVPFIEEIIFRGVLLGIFLRAMRPSVAIASLAFLFAVLHFLKPPPGVLIEDPGAAMAGLEMLSHIFQRFGDPGPLISEFGTLLSVGLVLGYARWRTASLWLPAGLHTGWVFALIFFKELTLSGPRPDGFGRYLVGYTLRDGIVPTVIVLATGILVHALTIPRDSEPTD
jgi:membrane protease YdiL (CAAX protease family)